MSENSNFTLVSEGGESSENTSVKASEVGDSNEAKVADEGNQNTTTANEERVAEGSKPNTTGSFKERLDRMRRREEAKREQALRDNDAKWEKRIKDLEDRLNATQKPNAVKRENFGSEAEYLQATRQNAISEIVDAIDKRNAEKASKEAEAKSKQDEESAYQRKFAEKFSTRMRDTLNEAQQKKVLEIISDDDSAVNVAVTSNEGKTFQSWLMDDADMPADVLLYLEENPDKLDRLLQLSPRKQIQQLDNVERMLARSYVENLNKRKQNNGGEQVQSNPVQRNVPLMGAFGGSTQAVSDDSQLSDTERVAKLIKAMRKR